MDIVATSQPLYDEELTWPSELWLSSKQCESTVDHDWQDDELELVGTSQPFEDGEEDLKFFGSPMTPGPSPPALHPHSKLAAAQPSTSSPLYPASMPSTLDSGVAIHPRRAHLVFRASPVKPRPTLTASQGPRSQSHKLVRRVTMAAEIERRCKRAEVERRRRRACQKARRIAKQIRALARATVKLQRQHRELCKFVCAES
ncbi:hypothetical protein C8R43DRAFT_1018848 [Mycena crocata]|nr:hypothetical protein C8R43DRAFT_1042275 [Mycena crocata]KAJ7140081.1 hypothetical protein C8R43DRAFT_1018848 [Mycena crocata]